MWKIQKDSDQNLPNVWHSLWASMDKIPNKMSNQSQWFRVPGRFSRSDFVPYKQHLPRSSLHIPLPHFSALLPPNKSEIKLEKIIVLRPVEVRGLEDNFPPWMVPSSKLTYLSPRHFCTWFSFSHGKICLFPGGYIHHPIYSNSHDRQMYF